MKTQLEEVKKIVLAGTSSGELCLELTRRLQQGTQVRLTHKGVRVTHAQYLDNLSKPEEIDNALSKTIS